MTNYPVYDTIQTVKGKEIKKMKWYRLRFSDGSHGAWTRDYERIKRDAMFFMAKIEVKE